MYVVFGAACEHMVHIPTHNYAGVEGRSGWGRTHAKEMEALHFPWAWLRYKTAWLEGCVKEELHDT